ncbi:MAG: phospholipase D-like domain-containing protein [Planctomycetota bacterium]
MKRIPWSILSLLLLSLVTLALAPSVAVAQSETLVVSPREKQDLAISKTLLEAKSSIYMALYSISSESEWVDDPGANADPADAARYAEFRAKLERGEVLPFDMIKWKASQGVTCRLVLHRAGLDPWTIASAKAYEAVGVEIRFAHKTMHHKFAIVDKQVLINGSGNWSRGAAERYSENTTIYRDHRWLVKKFLSEFYFLWYELLEEGKSIEFDEADLPYAEPDVNHFVEREVRHWDGDPVQAFFTSENGSRSEYTCADTIIREMQRAERSIVVLANHFNMGRISDALIAIHRERNLDQDPDNDVEIKVLMDLGEYDAGLSGISRSADLERAGIECRYKTFSLAFFYPRSQFMHHKVLITDSSRMITGSYNWSSTAEHKNYENITLHQGPSQQDLIDAMEQEFTYLWDLNRGNYEPFLAAVRSQPGDANYKRYVPHHFLPDLRYYSSPMSLTRDELDAIRDALPNYTPPPHDGADDSYSRLYFDKETGELVSQTPPGTFIDGEQDNLTPLPPPMQAPEVTPSAGLTAPPLADPAAGNTPDPAEAPKPAAPGVTDALQDD